MKKILLSCAAMAALIFSSCSENGKDPIGGETGLETGNFAYVSIKVKNPTQGGLRASTETGAVGDEAKINSLYLLTFDATGSYLPIPGGAQPQPSLTPAAIKIDARTAKILVIANPGTKLQALLSGFASGTQASEIQTAIKGVTVTDITSDAAGFAMINQGDPGTNGVTEVTLEDALVDVASKIQKVSAFATEAEAEAAANLPANKAEVKLERLVSKLNLRIEGTITTPERKKEDGTLIGNDKFYFTNWTVDILNTAYYAFADKTMFTTGHTGTDYLKNFYTEDPNFTAAPLGADMAYATIGADYEPVLPFYDWLNNTTTRVDATTTTDATKIAYVIENTMAANAQLFGNATRVVIKATYFPAGFDEDDWFAFGNTYYNTIKEVVDAYNVNGATASFKTAVEGFAAQLGVAAADISEATLTTAMTGVTVPNGGQYVKYGSNSETPDPITGNIPRPTAPVLRWYDGGLCYYYYEVRHDDEINGEMAFGKYGVVRNNWYNLRIDNVTGPGTPWYPDVNNPGGGDPGKEDPIDQGAAFIGIVVEPVDWIIWDNDISI
jgi:hypothetical protein